MKTPKERLSKRVQMAVQREGAGFPTIAAAGKTSASCGPQPALPAIADPAPMSLEERLELEAEGDALVRDILLNLDEEKRDTLLDMCKRECLQVVIRQFGIAGVLFQDKDGGNVDTINNVRSGIYATIDEKNLYEQRGEYDSTLYHSHEEYKSANKTSSATQKQGTLIDSYSSRIIGVNEKKNQDHVKSAKENHDDGGRILAGINGEDIANIKSNLKVTTETINKSKKQKSVEEFIAFVEDVKIPRLKIAIPDIGKKIAAIEATPSPSSNELKKLANYKNLIEKWKNDLKKFEDLDKNKLRQADREAREDINRVINWKYYTSNKFFKNTAITSVKESARMGLQQSIGMLMEEFVCAAFDEMKDAWRNGVREKIDQSFWEALVVRLKRIADRVSAKWRDAVQSFKDGAVSGFLSNLLTVAINCFLTTVKKWVRIIREGVMSLYGAFKMLAFPPEGMTLEQAAHEASKLLVAGAVVGLGVFVEESISELLFGEVGKEGSRATIDLLKIHPVLATILPYAIPTVVGLVTGLTTACATYMLDRLDLFGVNQDMRRDLVTAKLKQIIDESGIEATEVFDGPALLHLPSPS